MSDVDIVYEDDDILAINKPAGISVHSDGKTNTETLVDWILKAHPEMSAVGEPLVLDEGGAIPRPGIIHRLDKETSGILLLAKSQDAYLHLKEQFQKRRIGKTYNAFVYGNVKREKGIITSKIGRSRKDFRLRAVEGAAYGTLREAITYFQVLRRNKDATYVEVYPQTGRTHQIRVHFKSVGYPVICDALYAPKRPCLLGFARLALHARVLSILSPSGKRLILEAPLPDDFEHALEEIAH